MKSSEQNEFQNPSLSEIQQIAFKMLGSFPSQSLKLTTTIQKKQIEEPIADFDKFNLIDNKSEISKTIIKFKKWTRKYCSLLNAKNGTPFIFIDTILQYPNFLQTLVLENTEINDPSKKDLILYSFQYFIAYVVYIVVLYNTMDTIHDNNISINKIDNQVKNTIETLLCDYEQLKTKYNISYVKNINENAEWKTLDTIFLTITKNKLNSEQINYTKIFIINSINHFLFLNIQKALIHTFNITEEEINNSLNKNNIYNLTYQVIENFTKKDSYKNNRFSNLYNLIITNTPKDLNKNLQSTISSILICSFGDKVLNTTKKINIDEYKKEIDRLLQITDVTTTEIYNLWFTARIKTCNLTFDNSPEYKQEVQSICNLYREAFKNGKYILGKNLKEFLSDAIVTDIYFNKIVKKNILNNTQDYYSNDANSSIHKTSKVYWSFGYALGLFSFDSQKTYLLAYNAGINFWNNFHVSCFNNSESAKKQYLKDTFFHEYTFLDSANKYFKTKTHKDLLSEKRKNYRINVNDRFYSVLSVAIMCATTDIDFMLIKNYINRINEEVLIKNDECGASPLIRALYLYKMYSYGYSYDLLIKRDKALSNFCTNIWKDWDYISDAERIDILKQETFKLTNIYTNYNILFNNSQKNEQMCTNLKTKIILPLINKIGKSKHAKHLLDEAISLNTKNFVSALQLAIDCCDYEIVQLLINFLSNEDLSKLLISDEYLTPLQYAIRKYDYLKQYYTNFIQTKDNKQIDIINLKKTELPKKRFVYGSIIKEDNDFISIKLIPKMFELLSCEECGLLIDILPSQNKLWNKSIFFTKQKDLYKIITEILAPKTNPISVSTFYYLVDMTNKFWTPVSDDILEIAKILIETNHAQLSDYDFDYTKGYLPQETLIGKCFRDRKYSFAKFLLSNYPQNFTKILNTRIVGIDYQEKFKYDTDSHLFILNMKMSIQEYKKMNGIEKENYGRQIRYTLDTVIDLLIKAGADFNIQDQDCVTVNEILEKWKDELPNY